MAGDRHQQLGSATPGPDGVTTNENTAAFVISGSDPAGFSVDRECTLDDIVPFDCFDTLGPLPDGPHELTVVGRTDDGRQAPAVTYDWTVDATPPTVVAPRLPKTTLGGPLSVHWSATDAGIGVSHHQGAVWLARADGTTFGWTTPVEWTALGTPRFETSGPAAGETLCIAVRSVDDVGNSSAWTAPSCTARPYDDRSLKASTGWNRGTGDQYWKGTITSTTGVDKTLRRLDIHLNRVGILATVCPTCGIVDVFVDDTKIRRINLERTTTTHQKAVLLPAFALRTGDVTITSVTTGKSIRIDGLVAVRATNTVPPP